MKKFRYDTIFTYGSLQSVGHTTEYFAKNTRKLVVFIIMPRGNKMPNIVRVYREGVLKSEHGVQSSTNIFLYYLLWWYFQTVFLLRYFTGSEKIIMLAGHPIAFFGMGIMKLFRKITYAYWIGDYFPPVHWSLILFEKLKKFYHDKVTYTYYLSDRLNELYNGRVVAELGKRTVMWGVQPFAGTHKAPVKEYRLLFVGVIRPSQGIEDLLLYLKQFPNVYVSILGSCEKHLYDKYMSIIYAYGITKRVWIPNKFIDDARLRQIASRHHVGIALYEKGLHTATHYTDPGKVKTYIELGLPIVMTDTSAIEYYIRKFNAGEVVGDVSELTQVLNLIKQNYILYQKGVASIAKYFEFDMYYKFAFRSLEDL